MKLKSLMVVSVMVLFVLAISPLAASDKAPPQDRDCDGEFQANEYNDRIDCKAENANAAMFEWIDSVIDFEKMRRELGRASVFTDAQMDHLMSARERAQSAKNRSHAAKAFLGPARKQKARNEDCYVMEIIGDNKGDDIQPCEKDEDCSEVLGDGIGDDNGICKIKGNPNQREVCIEICQQPLLDDEDAYDPDAAADTEQGLEELEIALNDATSEVKSAMARMQSQHAERPASGADECTMFEFGLFPGSGVLQTTQIVKNVADAAFNSCSVVCNQDVFGWNCEAACVVFAVISGIANSVNDGFAVRDGSNGSEQLDRVAKCTQQLNTDLGALTASSGDTEAAVAEINLKVDDLAKQIESLMLFVQEQFAVVEGHLCVPQGQRECFQGNTNRSSTSLRESGVSQRGRPAGR